MNLLSMDKALDILEEIEGVITKLRHVFMGTPETMGNKILSTDNLGELLQFVTAYYSWAVTLWGNVKSTSERTEQTRKMNESKAFIRLRIEDTKMIAKETEARALKATEGHILEEMEWRAILNRTIAVKIALENFIKTIDSLKYIKTKEWNATE